MDQRSSSNMDPVEKLLFEPVPTLKELAALKIIIAMYPNCLEENDDEQDGLANYLGKSRKQLYEKFVSLGLLPTSVRKLLDTRASSIYEEIQHWTSNLIDGNTFIEIFCELDPKIRKLCIQHCIWKQNGKIDYKKTAQNLCKCSDLSADEKFAIMCKYGLKDEIDGISLDEISPVMKDLENVEVLLHYWINYKKNELHKLPLVGFRSMEEFMLQEGIAWDTWACAEYFFDCLSPDDQVSLIQDLIFNGAVDIYLKNIWAKMSHSQRSAILSVVPDKVVVIFWYDCEFELAYAIWMQIREFIIREQFAKLVRALLIETKVFKENVRVLFSIDIWNSATDHFKEYALNNAMNDIFSGIHGINLNLLLTMLKYASAEYRKDFIEMYGDMLKLVENGHPILEDVFSLCLS